MDSKATKKNLDIQLSDIVNRSDCIYEMQFSIENIKLGTLKIRFDFCNDKIPAKDANEIVGDLKWIMNDLNLYICFFMANLESNLKLTKKYRDSVNQSSALATSTLFVNKPKAIEIFKSFKTTALGRMVYAYEGGLFNLIRDEGLGILCNPDAFERFEEKMKDENVAGTSINKLRDSLLEYAYKRPAKDLPSFPTGRPERELAQRIGDETINELYGYFKDIFKEIKSKFSEAGGGIPSADNIFEIAYTWGEEYFENIFNMIEEIRPDITDQDTTAAIKSAQQHSLNELLNFIRSDKKLKQDFLEFKWQPHEFAKKVLKKLLDISFSKLTKIIYKPRKI